jgi:hypothetical protein
MIARRLAVALIIGILTTVAPASAQTEGPTFELSAAYQFTHVPDENLPLGFAIDASRNWGMLGLVAEGGWAHESDDSLGFDTSLNLWHIGAGPRWSGRRSPTFTPYAQVIAGITHTRSTIGSGSAELKGSETSFMLQPGAGVSVVAGDGWAVFGAVDYRRVFLGDDVAGVEDENQFRFLIGLRMQLE